MMTAGIDYLSLMIPGHVIKADGGVKSEQCIGCINLYLSFVRLSRSTFRDITFQKHHTGVEVFH